MSKQFFYLSLFLSTCLLVNISCSSKNIKPLTEIEIAQRLLKEQKIQGESETPLPIKINVSQPGKAITDKSLDLEFEVSSDKALPYITIIFQPREGLKLKPRWLLLKRDTQTVSIKNITADKLYRQNITVIPDQKGLLGLDIYTLSEIDKVKKARLQTMYFSIGDPLKKTSKTRPVNVNIEQ